MSGLKIDKSEANLEKTLFSTLLVFFKKWANPGLFFVYFQSLQTNNTILTTNQCEKMLCPSSMRHWDSNPRTSEYESPPITTSPGLVFAFETCEERERERFYHSDILLLFKIGTTILLFIMMQCRGSQISLLSLGGAFVNKADLK